jgi:hypothetical protein
LENELHHYFRDSAVNAVNKRKEFFFAKPSEVREVLIEKVGNLLEFSETAESLEYFQSNKYWPKNINVEQQGGAESHKGARSTL